MLSLNFDPFPTLETERLILRKTLQEDAADLFRLRSDERVLKYLLRDPAKSLEEIHAFIEKVDKGMLSGQNVLWALQLKDQPGMIGNIGLRNFIEAHYRAEVGYTLFPEHFGKGIMQEALEAVLKYGFQTLKLHTVTAITDPHNTASQKLLKRNGFVQEGYFREDYHFNGKFYDSTVYSLINPFGTHAERP